jgi:serine/threonine protein kinase
MATVFIDREYVWREGDRASYEQRNYEVCFKNTRIGKRRYVSITTDSPAFPRANVHVWLAKFLGKNVNQFYLIDGPRPDQQIPNSVKYIVKLIGKAKAKYFKPEHEVLSHLPVSKYVSEIMYYVGYRHDPKYIVINKRGVALTQFKKDFLDNDNTWKRFMSDMINAIKFMHEHGVVHMDLKPANIAYNSSTSTFSVFDFDKSFLLGTLSESVVYKGYKFSRKMTQRDAVCASLKMLLKQFNMTHLSKGQLEVFFDEYCGSVSPKQPGTKSRVVPIPKSVSPPRKVVSPARPTSLRPITLPENKRHYLILQKVLRIREAARYLGKQGKLVFNAKGNKADWSKAIRDAGYDPDPDRFL